MTDVTTLGSLDVDVGEPERHALKQLVADRVIGQRLHQNQLIAPRQAATRFNVFAAAQPERPSDDRGGLIHPFRVFDMEQQAEQVSTLLSIACEPFAWEVIRGDFTTRRQIHRLAGDDLIRNLAARARPGEEIPVTPELLVAAGNTPEDRRAGYENALFDLLRRVGKAAVEAERGRLMLRTYECEPNLNVLRICRFLSAHDREGLRGRLRFALMLWEMAECIRRAAEAALGCELPEEDLILPLSRLDTDKEEMFGQLRGFDRRATRHRFVRTLGVDFGPRAICYVEGATEAGALDQLMHPEGGVQVLDLAGQGLSPRLHELLKQDQRRRVLSAMVVDGDNADLVREVRQAADAGLLTMGFAICDPDFEMGIDATEDDLTMAFGSVWRTRCDSPCPDEEFRQGLAECGRGRQVETLAERLCLPSLKGAEWGAALALRVARHAAISAESAKPFWNLVFRLLQAQRSSLLWETTVGYSCVDLETGRLVRRPSGG